MTQHTDSIAHLQLDEEEAELLQSYEADEWQTVSNVNQLREQFQIYATEMIESSEKFGVNISIRDARTLRAKALEEGVAPESLVAMVVHKFVTGRLVEKANPTP